MKWYSFTAPEDGYYNLYGNASLTSSVQAAVYTDLENKEIRRSSFSKDKALNLRTNYVNAGEAVYFSIYKEWYDVVSYEIQVQKLTISPFAIQQDGTYRAETEEYILNIIPETGNRVIRFQAVLEAKEGAVLKNSYRLETYYRNTKSKRESYSDNGLYADYAYRIKDNLEVDSESEIE